MNPIRHYVFHVPCLISVYEVDPDTNTEGPRDHSRRHVDVHVWAEDVEAASTSMEEKLQILLGEEFPAHVPYVSKTEVVPAEPEAPAVDTVGFPYIGPV